MFNSGPRRTIGIEQTRYCRSLLYSALRGVLPVASGTITSLLFLYNRLFKGLTLFFTKIFEISISVDITSIILFCSAKVLLIFCS